MYRSISVILLMCACFSAPLMCAGQSNAFLSQLYRIELSVLPLAGFYYDCKYPGCHWQAPLYFHLATLSRLPTSPFTCVWRSPLVPALPFRFVAVCFTFL